jgi:hypothetical protein
MGCFNLFCNFSLILLGVLVCCVYILVVEENRTTADVMTFVCKNRSQQTVTITIQCWDVVVNLLILVQVYPSLENSWSVLFRMSSIICIVHVCVCVCVCVCPAWCWCNEWVIGAVYGWLLCEHIITIIGV